jgi:hypothetical protein
MDVAEFSYPRWNTTATAIASVLVLVFPAAILVGAVWVLIEFALSDTNNDTKSLCFGSFGLLFGVWAVTMLWQRIRFRHVLRSRYVFDANGVAVESGESKTFVPWQEVECAEYFPLFFLLRLKSALTPTPVVVFETGGPDGKCRYSDRWEFTTNMIRSRLHDRFRKRWLP